MHPLIGVPFILRSLSHPLKSDKSYKLKEEDENMTGQSDLTNLSNEARAQNLVRVIERFIRTLYHRAGRRHASDVIHGSVKLKGTKIQQEPERFIAEELIEPVGKVLGYELRFEPRGFDGLRNLTPDFTAINLECENFGEIKTPGGIKRARKESFQYLGRAVKRPIIGIATDGFIWILHTAGKEEQPAYTSHASLRDLIRSVRLVERTSISEARHPHQRELAMKFVSEFNIEAVTRSIMD